MATTTNFGWETPDDTDLVKDGAAAIRTSLNGVDASFVDLKGGTTGQVLSKATNADLDFAWVAADDTNAIQNAIIDAKGDLIVGASDNTPARLPIGSNGYVLTADSAQTYGVKWAAAGGGGKVLQVVSNTYSTQTTLTTTTQTDSGLSCSITPTASTSKILVMVLQPLMTAASDRSAFASVRLMRDSTVAWTGDGTSSGVTYGILDGSSSDYAMLTSYVSIHYLDSPATTSSVTYKTQGRLENTSASAEMRFQYTGTTAQMILLEIGA